MFAYSRSYPTSTYGQQDKPVSAKQPVRSSVVWLSEPNTPAEVLDSPPEKKPPLTALIIVRHAERIDSVLGKPPPAGKEGGYPPLGPAPLGVWRPPVPSPGRLDP